MPEEVFTRDASSGRIHRQFRGKTGKLYSIEADNLDDAGEAIEITEAEANAAPANARCRNCFPAIPDISDTPVEPI